jgi:competence protein ComEC
LVALWLAQFGLKVDSWWLAPAAGLLLVCRIKLTVYAVPAVLIATSLAGLWLGGSFNQQLTGYKIFLGQKVNVVGNVVEDATYNDKKQLDFKLTNVQINNHKLPGELRITTFAIAKPHRGDQVLASGKLYDGFGGYQAAVYYADAKIIALDESWVGNLRRVFAAAVYTVLPEPQASLGLGFLVGIKSQLPDELNDQLRLAGLTHIVVASGYNLTILIRLARRIFEKRSKYQTALSSVLLMAGFVAVTGFSPSMCRAALVCGLSLAAWYYGRHIHPVLILLLSAAVTAALNPLFLWHDLGWWLSFLAFAGVMLLAPLIQHRLFGDRQPKIIGQVIIESISAQIVTLPLVVAVFGSLPLLALPANVLVVPLVPLTMLLTFIAGTANFAVPLAAPFFALPAAWLLSYITELVRWFASAGWSLLNIPFNGLAMIGAYLTIFTVGLILWRVTKHSYLSRSLIE